MGYMFRYNPAFQLCYRAVREGWLGEVFSVDAVMGKVVDKASRQALLKYPGGAMFELGCHVIDSVIKVLGKPQKLTAHGRSSSAFKDGLLDNQLAVLDYPGATATVRANFVEVEGGARRQFVVCGTRGTLDIRPLEPPHIRLALDAPHEGFKKGYQDLALPRLPRYDGEFMDLAKVIRDEKAFEWPPAHDLTVQEAVLLGSGLKAK
jgi:predicted dehydrogenase